MNETTNAFSLTAFEHYRTDTANFINEYLKNNPIPEGVHYRELVARVTLFLRVYCDVPLNTNRMHLAHTLLHSILHDKNLGPAIVEMTAAS